jgi:hypothetical protein
LEEFRFQSEGISREARLEHSILPVCRVLLNCGEILLGSVRQEHNSGFIWITCGVEQ